MIGAKARPITARISALKEIQKNTTRDHSDPTRRKVNLFEIKPNERPTSKIEALKKENKDLANMLENNKQLIQELYESSNKEREKLVDELINLFNSLNNQKNGISVAINFLKQFKDKIEATASISNLTNDNDHRRNLTSKLKNDWGTDTFEKFDTKHSNEYLSKTYCHKCRTKPSSSDYSCSEEDLFKSKVKVLQDNLETAEKRYSEAEMQIKQLTNEIDLLKFENDNLKETLKESNAITETFLSYIKDKNAADCNAIQSIKDKKSESFLNKTSGNIKIWNEYHNTSGKISPLGYESHHKSNDFLLKDIKKCIQDEPLPSFAKCLAIDLDKIQFQRVSKDFTQTTASKITSFSMYKNSAVRKKQEVAVFNNWGPEKVCEDSCSLSDSMKVDDSSVEKGHIHQMLIVSDMMDKSHSKSPMHLIFDLA